MEAKPAIPGASVATPIAANQLFDQLARIEDKTSRIEDKYARSKSLLTRVEDKVEGASNRMNEAARQSDLAALRSEMRGLTERTRRVCGSEGGPAPRGAGLGRETAGPRVAPASRPGERMDQHVDQLAHRHGGVGHAVGEAPFIVVPGHDAHEVAVHHLGLVQREAGRGGIVVEIHRHQLVMHTSRMPLSGPTAARLDRRR